MVFAANFLLLDFFAKIFSQMCLNCVLQRVFSSHVRMLIMSPGSKHSLMICRSWAHNHGPRELSGEQTWGDLEDEQEAEAAEEAETEAGTDAEPEAEAAAEMESEAEAETEAESKAEAEGEPEPEADAEPEAEQEPEADAVTEDEPEPKADAEPEAV